MVYGGTNMLSTFFDDVWEFDTSTKNSLSHTHTHGTRINAH